jgi:hypothetical protein
VLYGIFVAPVVEIHGAASLHKKKILTLLLHGSFIQREERKKTQAAEPSNDAALTP